MFAIFATLDMTPQTAVKKQRRTIVIDCRDQTEIDIYFAVSMKQRGGAKRTEC